MRNVLLASLLFAAIFVLPLASAQALPGDNLISSSPGTTPDSWLYPIDVFIDNVGLAFTFDPQAKAQLGLKLAGKRLLQVKAMAEQNKTREADIAEHDYDTMLNVTKQAIDAIPEDTTNESVARAISATAKIQDDFEELQLKAAIVIENVAARVIANAPEQAKAVLNSTFARIGMRLDDVAKKLESKRESEKAKLKAVTEKNESEIEGEIGDIENESGLDSGRSERIGIMVERARARFDSIIESVKGMRVSDDVKAQIIEKVGNVSAGLDASAAAGYEDRKKVAVAASEFGQTISELAQRIRTGEVTPHQLVSKAIEQSSRVLIAIESAAKATSVSAVPEISSGIEGVSNEIETELPETNDTESAIENLSAEASAISIPGTANVTA